MILVIDIGNTNIKFGVFFNGKQLFDFKQRTINDETSDEIGLFICNVFRNRGYLIEDVKDVIISSVVPQIMFSFVHAIVKYVHKDPIIVGENLNYDFSYISEKDISEAADRLVCCYYAHKKYKKSNKIVIDFGTATTFDVINDQGNYLGGAILPGVRILSDSLQKNTAQLPKTEIGYPKTLRGVNVIDQIKAGVIYGYIGAVRNINQELISQVLNSCREEVVIVATGGFSSLIGQNGRLFDVINKNLMLEGLFSLYNEHKNNLNNIKK